VILEALSSNPQRWYKTNHLQSSAHTSLDQSRVEPSTYGIREEMRIN
jgi:hypothetical protein